MLTIFCLVRGEPATNAFPIEIDENKNIGTLRELIKSKKKNRFHDIDANELKLWSVSISVDDTSALGELVLENNKEKGVQELFPVKKISKIFSEEPAEEHIHIIVERPTGKKEIHCKATYGRNTVTFQWTPTLKNTSLAELKTLLRGCFTFPDGTEDKDIGISRDAIRKKDGLLLRLLKDSELISMVWDNGYQAELSLVVDTSQRAFSSWDFAKIRPLFGLTATSYKELPTFEMGCVDKEKYTDNMEYVFGDLLVCNFFIFLFIEMLYSNAVIYINGLSRESTRHLTLLSVRMKPPVVNSLVL